MTAVYAILGIVALSGWGLAWYFRTKAAQSSAGLDAMTSKAQEIAVAYNDLVGSYNSAMKRLKVLNDEAEATDIASAAKVTSPADAAEFLRDSGGASSKPKASLRPPYRARRPCFVTGFGRGQCYPASSSGRGAWVVDA
jgi:hypothetical protein